MTKNQLIHVISEETGLPLKDVRLVFETCFSHIEREVSGGNRVTLSGFGTFEAIRRTVSFHRDGIIHKKQTVIPVFHAGEQLKRICRRE